jgi:hypothetical protein
MDRIFGGSPASVLLRLVIISIIVGIVLRALGIRPLDLIRHFDEFFRHLSYYGVDALNWGLRYFLLGAIIVFPIWAVYRLIKVLGDGSGGKGGSGKS